MVLFKSIGVGAIAASIAAVAANDSWDPNGFPAPPPLFAETNELSSACPARNIKVRGSTDFTSLGRPIPTNTWWGNLISCDPQSNGSVPIWSNPYAIVPETVRNGDNLYGFAMSYPFRSRFFGGSSPNPGAVQFYAHAMIKEVHFSADEFAQSTPEFEVTDWTDHGVNMLISIASGSRAIEAQFVSGMAYVTARYTDLSPKVIIGHPILTINGNYVSSGSTVSGNRFVIETVSGQHWVLYALDAEPIEFTLETIQILRSTRAFSGILRVAAVFPETPIEVYDAHSMCIATGGTIDLIDDVSYDFRWHIDGNCTSGLLHFGLPHHETTLTRAHAVPLDGVLMHSTTRGAMQAYVTTTTPPKWAFQERHAMRASFYPLNRPSSSANAQQEVLKTLFKDIMSPWNIATTKGIYTSGKVAQKYASLCLMANDPNIVGTDVSLLRKCVVKLQRIVTPFLDNTWLYPLNYDRYYGGIVSRAGFDSGDLNAEFGNTVYNDHHFHYGYWIYCAAVLNYLNPQWTRLEELNTITRTLLRDVANPTDVDPYFPKFRNYDWFRGHSYSHGVTPFGDGKDEESSSEDVNFAYSLYLYGTATGDDRMRSVGRLMSRLTAHAIQTYFLIEDNSNVHPAQFRPNKVTGILFDNKADYSTWFSAELHCIHGIQMIPVTPMTEFVRTRTFVQEEWDSVLSRDRIVQNEDASNPWLSLLYANYAAVDPTRALAALQYIALDNGLARSWALYMSLSRVEE